MPPICQSEASSKQDDLDLNCCCWWTKVLRNIYTARKRNNFCVDIGRASNWWQLETVPQLCSLLAYHFYQISLLLRIFGPLLNTWKSLIILTIGQNQSKYVFVSLKVSWSICRSYRLRWCFLALPGLCSLLLFHCGDYNEMERCETYANVCIIMVIYDSGWEKWTLLFWMSTERKKMWQVIKCCIPYTLFFTLIEEIHSIKKPTGQHHNANESLLGATSSSVMYSL